MRVARGLLVLLAAAAVVVAYTHRHGDAGGPVATVATAPTKGSVEIVFAYSSNLEEMMATLVPRFNAAGVESDGHRIFVRALAASSGDVEAKIAAGRLRPHAWSPASSLWGRLLDYETDRKYVPDENLSLASSPVVIAMWEPLARALGWPRRPIGFADILRLATTR